MTADDCTAAEEFVRKAMSDAWTDSEEFEHLPRVLAERLPDWARAHLAAHEPTDAEVKAADIALLAVIHNEPVERIREVFGVLDRDGHRSTQIRAALSAARAARRDEETR